MEISLFCHLVKSCLTDQFIGPGKKLIIKKNVSIIKKCHGGNMGTVLFMLVFWAIIIVILIIGGFIWAVFIHDPVKEKFPNATKEEIENIRKHNLCNGPQADIFNYSAGYINEVVGVDSYGGFATAYTNSFWHENMPDRFGNWAIKFDIRSTGNKTIKYAYITFVAYNRVGDLVQGEPTFKASFVGPLAYFETKKNLIVHNAWTDPSLKKIEIKEIELIFTDGTSQIIHKNGSVKNIGFGQYNPDSIVKDNSAKKYGTYIPSGTYINKSDEKLSSTDTIECPNCHKRVFKDKYFCPYCEEILDK